MTATPLRRTWPSERPNPAEQRRAILIANSAGTPDAAVRAVADAHGIDIPPAVAHLIADAVRYQGATTREHTVEVQADPRGGITHDAAEYLATRARHDLLRAVADDGYGPIAQPVEEREPASPRDAVLAARGFPHRLRVTWSVLAHQLTAPGGPQ